MPDWDTPQAVAAIVYYSNIDQTGGATALEPRQQENDKYDEMYDTQLEMNLRTPGMSGISCINNKHNAELMMAGVDEVAHQARQRAYEREVYINNAKVGTVLFF